MDRIRHAIERSAFDHVGVVTGTAQAGEAYSEEWRCWTTDPIEHPAHVDWCRFVPDGPASQPV